MRKPSFGTILRANHWLDWVRGDFVYHTGWVAFFSMNEERCTLAVMGAFERTGARLKVLYLENEPSYAVAFLAAERLAQIVNPSSRSIRLS